VRVVTLTTHAAGIAMKLSGFPAEKLKNTTTTFSLTSAHPMDRWVTRKLSGWSKSGSVGREYSAASFHSTAEYVQEWRSASMLLDESKDVKRSRTNERSFIWFFPFSCQNRVARNEPSYLRVGLDGLVGMFATVRTASSAIKRTVDVAVFTRRVRNRKRHSKFLLRNELYIIISRYSSTDSSIPSVHECLMQPE